MKNKSREKRHKKNTPLGTITPAGTFLAGTGRNPPVRFIFDKDSKTDIRLLAGPFEVDPAGEIHFTSRNHKGGPG